MGGKKIVGGIALFVGVICAIYSIVRLNSFGSQLARELGMSDTTGIGLLVLGVILGIIGISLVASK